MKEALILLNLSVVAGLFFWVWRKDTSRIKKFYWPAALVKLMAGVAVGAVHFRYYPQSDTAYFFEAALRLNELAKQDFTAYAGTLFSAPDGNFLGEHRSLAFIKMVSVAAWITGGNYYISSLLFSLVSFLAAWHLAVWISRLEPALGTPAVVALLFFPSCVFWSAGILKESLVMAAMYYLVAVIIKIRLRHRLSMLNFLLLIPAVWIMWSLKYYYAAVFLPVAMAFLVMGMVMTKKVSFFREVGSFIGIMLLLLFAGGIFHPNLQPGKIPRVIYETHQLLLVKSNPENEIHYHNLKPTWGSLAAHAPVALLSGLFAPVVPRFSNPLQVLAVFENLVILVLTVLSIPSLKRLPQSPYRLGIVAILVYVVLLAVFLALSTPNLGTLVRYRVGFLPFFVMLITQQPFLRHRLDPFFGMAR